MTSSRSCGRSAALPALGLVALLGAQPGAAALGAAPHVASAGQAVSLSAAASAAPALPRSDPTQPAGLALPVMRKSVQGLAQYAVHELQKPDGSRLQELVTPQGQVFAVRWNTLTKPDLRTLLGNSFGAYSQAAQQAARRGGIQRHFRHDAGDLVVQSTGHLHTFSGYAYLRSQWPAGVTPRTLGWE